MQPVENAYAPSRALPGRSFGSTPLPIRLASGWSTSTSGPVHYAAVPRERSELETISPSAHTDRPRRYSKRLRVLLGFVAAILVSGVVGYSIGASHDEGEAQPIRACPHSEYPFEMPPRPNESGDGLPPSGEATYKAAARVEDQLRHEYGAVDFQILEVDGRAWRRTPTGEVEVIPETIFVIRLTLKNAASCPGAPLSAPNPVKFEYRTG